MRVSFASDNKRRSPEYAVTSTHVKSNASIKLRQKCVNMIDCCAIYLVVSNRVQLEVLVQRASEKCLSLALSLF